MKEDVLILKTVRNFDSHLLVHALSLKGECLSFWAPFALKSQRRFGSGVLNPTHYVSLMYKKAKKPWGLDILEEGVLLKSFLGLSKSYQRMELALYFMKLIFKVSQKGMQDNASLFYITKKALETAETYADLKSLKLYFEFRLLEQQGVLPLYCKEEKQNFIDMVFKRSRRNLEGEHKLKFLRFKNQLREALSAYIH